MPRVLQAEPPRCFAMSSTGDAAGMYVRQFQFPNTYSNDDQLWSADDDRLCYQDRDHYNACFTKHLGTGPLALGDWCERSSDSNILSFVKDMLKAPDDKWTGYRILGTVNRSNGYPVWTLQLFAKHPDSDTVVYTGANAPNVRKTKSGMYGDDYVEEL